MNTWLRSSVRIPWLRLWRSKRDWLIAITVIVLVTLGLMRNWLGAGLPTSARREVLTEMTIVWMFRDEMAQGHLITGWNPYWFSGFPWLRFLSYPVYYAAAGISYWGALSLENTLKLFYILVMAGSGLAMYGYLRRVTRDWRAALVGALIYELVPFHAHVGVETWIHAAFWMVLPLPLWAIECDRSRRARRVACLVVCGLTLGLYPIVSSEYAILAGIFVVPYIIARQVVAWRKREISIMQALMGLALVAIIALGLSAFFLIPAAAEINQVGIHAKHAGGSTFEDVLIRNYSVTPRLVWYSIAKRFRLPVGTEGLPSIYSSFWSIAWYPGVIVPILAVLGLVQERRQLALQFAAIGLLLAILLVTGPSFSLNLFSRVPVVGRLSPFRGLMLVTLFGSALCAFGVRWLLTLVDNQWLAIGLALTLVLGVGLDYASSAHAFQTTNSYFSADEQVVYDWLMERKDKGRLWEPAYLPRDQYLRSYSVSELPMYRYVGYYDNGAPLYTWQQNSWADLDTALSLHQVRYVLLHDDEPNTPELEDVLEQAGYELAFGSGDVWVWENSVNGAYARLYGQSVLDITDNIYESFQALPRLQSKQMAMVMADENAHLDHYGYVLGSEVDLERRDIADQVSPESLIGLHEIAELRQESDLFAQVWSDRLAWDDIYVEVQSLQPVVLTIAESWYPHWRVEIDDQPGEVLRVNWALLGVRLDAGMHRIRFYYQRPWYLHLGYGITLLTVLSLMLWAARYLAKRVSRSPGAEMERIKKEALDSLRRDS